MDQCDDEGNFNVRRCAERQDDGPRYGCWCVHPDTGMEIPNTMRDVDDTRDFEFDRSDCLRRGNEICC